MNAAPGSPPEPGERALWRGRPRADLRFGGSKMIAVGIFAATAPVAALGATWLLAANNDGFWPVALIGLGLALAMLLGWPLLDRWQRARSHDALTDRRALVRIGRRAGTVESWPILAPGMLRIRRGAPDTAVFGIRRGVALGSTPGAGYYRIDDGFEIPALMPRLARGQTA